MAESATASDLTGMDRVAKGFGRDLRVNVGPQTGTDQT